MKTRIGFVSNSSSSSFCIFKNDLTTEQIEKIKTHGSYAEEFELDNDPWDIREVDDMVAGETWMDNFDMHYFLEKIGVPMDKVDWGEMPMFGFVDDILVPAMKEDQQNFVERLELEVAGYLKQWRAWELNDAQMELNKFVEWVKGQK